MCLCWSASMFDLIVKKKIATQMALSCCLHAEIFVKRLFLVRSRWCVQEKKINVLFWLLGRKGGEQLFLEYVLVAHTFGRNWRVCLMPVNPSGGGMQSTETQLSHLPPRSPPPPRAPLIKMCVCVCVAPSPRCGGGACDRKHIWAKFLGLKK